MVRSLLPPMLASALSLGLLSPAAAQNCTPNQVIPIADTALRSAISGALAKSGSPVTCEDVPKLAQLDASGRRIESLAGLEFFKKIHTLFLNNNRIRDVSKLEGLVDLTDLHLEDNFVADLTPLLRNVQTPPARSGISINVSGNCLDPTNGSEDALVRDRLQTLGVRLLTGGNPRAPADCSTR